MTGVAERLGAALADRYTIEHELGSGGMATVYLAEDLKHQRQVAIKVLKPELAAVLGADRFVQEITTTAQLQHPNILPLFDSGTADGFLYYVMPYIEGETLRAKLDREKQLGIDEAVRITTEIAEALDYAHRHGVIHRDIKPENILLHDGRPMVADFGIALAVSAAAGGRMTETGLSLGTPHYMSPEQATAEKDLTSRSDTYSLGAVLYEMLTGDPPHVGSTAQQIIMKIVTEDIAPVTKTRRSVPLNVAAAVAVAVEKLPADRFDSAKAFADALANRAFRASTEETVLAGRGRTRWKSALAAGVVLGVVATGAAARLGLTDGLLAGGTKGASGVDQVVFTQRTFNNQAIFTARFSHDGESVVYSAAPEGVVPHLYVLRAGYPDPRPLGDSATHLLSVSKSDELAVVVRARFVGHRQFRGTLARMPLGGGAPREVLAAVGDADWTPDGSDLAVVHDVNGADRIEFPIGHVLYQASGYASDLRFSPDGKLLAFLEHPSRWDDRGAVAVVDLQGNHRILTQGYWGLEGLAWSRDGKRVIFSGAAAGGFYQVHEVTLDGQARLVLPSAGTVTIQDVSSNGSWLMTRDDQFNRMMVKGPGAKSEQDLSWLDNSVAPTLSGDGQWLAFDDQGADAGANYAAMIRKTDGSPAARLGEGGLGAFSRDGQWVAAILPTTPQQLWLYPTGPGQAHRVDHGELESYATAEFFPDGKSLLVCGNAPGHATRCYVQPVGEGSLRPVTPEGTSLGEVAPDGRRFLALGPDGYRIYSVADSTSEPVPGLTAEDDVIRWSPDGRSLWVTRDLEPPVQVDQLDLATGKRSPLVTIEGTPHPGLVYIDEATLADDPRIYAYLGNEYVSHIFQVDGMR